MESQGLVLAVNMVHTGSTSHISAASAPHSNRSCSMEQYPGFVGVYCEKTTMSVCLSVSAVLK